MMGKKVNCNIYLTPIFDLFYNEFLSFSFIVLFALVNGVMETNYSQLHLILLLLATLALLIFLNVLLKGRRNLKVHLITDIFCLLFCFRFFYFFIIIIFFCA